MTRMQQTETDSTDHNNPGPIIDGAFNLDSMENYRRLRRIEMAPQLGKFSDLWDGICAQLQSPIQDEGTDRFSGYTGHRIVTLPSRMGQCALGFHLLKVANEDYRTIAAYRRKIYAQERRRKYYTSDSMSVSSSDIISSNYDPRVEFQMGVAASWLRLFELAPTPY